MIGQWCTVPGCTTHATAVRLVWHLGLVDLVLPVCASHVSWRPPTD